MNILIVPDSFKGSLSSKEVCENIKAGIDSIQKHNITCLPFADGGEGFGKCLCDFCNGNILYTYCSDIYLKRLRGIYTLTVTPQLLKQPQQAACKRKRCNERHIIWYGRTDKVRCIKGF